MGEIITLEQMQQMVNDAYETSQPYSYMVMAFEKVIRQAQQDAYEECAKLCEGEVPTGYDYPDGDDYAHAIRALKDKS